MTIIDDCYNANPVSMKASLDVLKDAEGRKVAILGDMFELGENEAVLHASVGVHAAGNAIDLLEMCIRDRYRNWVGSIGETDFFHTKVFIYGEKIIDEETVISFCTDIKSKKTFTRLDKTSGEVVDRIGIGNDHLGNAIFGEHIQNAV